MVLDILNILVSDDHVSKHFVLCVEDQVREDLVYLSLFLVKGQTLLILVHSVVWRVKVPNFTVDVLIRHNVVVIQRLEQLTFHLYFSLDPV